MHKRKGTAAVYVSKLRVHGAVGFFLHHLFLTILTASLYTHPCGLPQRRAAVATRAHGTGSTSSGNSLADTTSWPSASGEGHPPSPGESKAPLLHYSKTAINELWVGLRTQPDEQQRNKQLLNDKLRTTKSEIALLETLLYSYSTLHTVQVSGRERRTFGVSTLALIFRDDVVDFSRTREPEPQQAVKPSQKTHAWRQNCEDSEDQAGVRLYCQPRLLCAQTGLLVVAARLHCLRRSSPGST